MRNLQYLTLSLLILIGCAHKKEKKEKVPASQMPTLTQAYEYGFPLVLMDLTRETMTNVATPKDGKAPINQFASLKKLPDQTTKNMPRPNTDTMYSFAWVDLSDGPQILEVPDTDQRYYLAPMLDAWTNVYKSPGKRTTGTTRRRFLIAPPGWSGEAPTGVSVVQSPTNLTWIMGRVEVKNKADLKAVNKLQDGFKLFPLASYGKKHKAPKGKVNPEFNFIPTERIFTMSTEEYFDRLNRLLTENAPAAADKPLIDRLAAIGVGPGRNFDISKLNQRELSAIEGLPFEMRKKFNAEKGDVSKPVNGWVSTRGSANYGTDYHKRALMAYSGIGANLNEDALNAFASVDSFGERLTGDKTYAIHFNKEQLPQVNAFWSLTVYNDEQHLVKNPSKRFGIKSRDKLKYNEDGSLDIYLSMTSPGSGREANWIPTPAGNFEVTMRMYWPTEKTLEESYALPAITPISSPQNLSQAD